MNVSLTTMKNGHKLNAYQNKLVTIKIEEGVMVDMIVITHDEKEKYENFNDGVVKYIISETLTKEIDGEN